MIANRPWARRLLRGSVAAVCFLSLAVWALSTQRQFGVVVKGSFGLFSAHIHHGVIQVCLDRKSHYYNYHPEWTFRATEFGLTGHWGENLGFGFERFKGGFQGSFDILAPLGLLFILSLAANIGLWWRETQLFRPGQCLVCGYDLTGADHQRCPECGTPCDIKRPAAAEARGQTLPFQQYLQRLGLACSVVILSTWGGSMVLGYAFRQPGSGASVKTKAQASNAASAYMRKHYPAATAQIVQTYAIADAWYVIFQGSNGDYKTIRISETSGTEDLGDTYQSNQYIYGSGNVIP